MSAAHLTKVWEMLGIDGRELVTLLALAQKAGDDGVAALTIAQLQDMTRLDQMCVWKAVVALEMAGLLAVESPDDETVPKRFILRLDVGPR